MQIVVVWWNYLFDCSFQCDRCE